MSYGMTRLLRRQEQGSHAPSWVRWTPCAPGKRKGQASNGKDRHQTDRIRCVPIYANSERRVPVLPVVLPVRYRYR